MDKQRGKLRDESQQRGTEELLPFSETLIKKLVQARACICCALFACCTFTSAVRGGVVGLVAAVFV